MEIAPPLPLSYEIHSCQTLGASAFCALTRMNLVRINSVVRYFLCLLTIPAHRWAVHLMFNDEGHVLVNLSEHVSGRGGGRSTATAAGGGDDGGGAAAAAGGGEGSCCSCRHGVGWGRWVAVQHNQEVWGQHG